MQFSCPAINDHAAIGTLSQWAGTFCRKYLSENITPENLTYDFLEEATNLFIDCKICCVYHGTQ